MCDALLVSISTNFLTYTTSVAECTNTSNDSKEREKKQNKQNKQNKLSKRTTTASATTIKIVCVNLRIQRSVFSPINHTVADEKKIHKNVILAL